MAGALPQPISLWGGSLQRREQSDLPVDNLILLRNLLRVRNLFRRKMILTIEVTTLHYQCSTVSRDSDTRQEGGSDVT